MQKLSLSDIKIEKSISKGESSEIFMLSNGDFIKIFNSEFLKYPVFRLIIEKKVLLGDKYRGDKDLLAPKAICYNNSNFVAYIMAPLSGMNLNDYLCKHSINRLSDISLITELFLKIDNAIQRCNKKHIIFPDLCTIENIFIKEDGSVKFIDYDGIQIEDCITFCFSSYFGNYQKYLIPKYYDDSSNLFNSNLDKKSLACIYFQTVLGCDLESTMRKLRWEYKASTDMALEMIFSELNLRDYDFAQKISNLYKNNVENEYIAEDAKRISDTYWMELKPVYQRGEIVYKKTFFKK